MDTFTLGQTVTVKGTETHGLVVDVYTYQRTQKVSVRISHKTPPITYMAHELAAYVLQSPDMVMLMAPDGSPWFYEVYDVSGDEKTVCLKEGEAFYWVDRSLIVRVIPASVGRLSMLAGGR